MVMERTSASLACTTFKRLLLLTNLSLTLSDFCPTKDLSDDCQKQCEGLKLFDIVSEGCIVSFGCFYNAKMTALKSYSSTTSVVLYVVFPFKDLLTEEKGDDQWIKTVSVDFSKCQVEQELPRQF